MTKRKIALFGGTFDPIHLGHTTVAAQTAEYIDAEKVIFIPAKRSPLKDLFPKATDHDRLKMIALAIAQNNRFQLSDYELKEPQPCYTLETVRKFRTDYGSKILIYWLVGADCLNELPHWHKITELIDECNLSMMYRAGCKPPDFEKFETLWGPERVKKLQQNIIRTSLIDISGTEIRTRLATGRDVADMLDITVAEYIQKHSLYK